MIFYVIRRLLAAVPTLLAVLSLVFVIVRIVPGDPAIAILGDQATPAAVAALDHKLGLDKPMWQQYADFIGASLSGDFGHSMITGRPIVSEVDAVLPYTVDLTLAALLLGCIIGIPLGVWAALHRDRPIDYAARLVSLLGLSFPVFVSGIYMLLLFALHWHLFPVIGSARMDDPLDRLDKLVLPATTLGHRDVGLHHAGDAQRDAGGAGRGLHPHRARQGRALAPRRVAPRAAQRGDAGGDRGRPVFGILIGNSVLTEIVFNCPGLGSIIVAALNNRDYTMLQGLMVIYCFLIVVVNLLTDLTYGLIDPRVKHA